MNSQLSQQKPTSAAHNVQLNKIQPFTTTYKPF